MPPVNWRPVPDEVSGALRVHRSQGIRVEPGLEVDVGPVGDGPEEAEEEDLGGRRHL